MKTFRLIFDKSPKGTIYYGREVKAYIGLECHTERTVSRKDRTVVRDILLTPDCMSLSELEANIRILKKDLDAVAAEAKKKFAAYKKVLKK